VVELLELLDGRGRSEFLLDGAKELKVNDGEKCALASCLVSLMEYKRHPSISSGSKINIR